MQVEGDKTPVAASTLLEAASDLVMDKVNSNVAKDERTSLVEKTKVEGEKRQPRTKKDRNVELVVSPPRAWYATFF